MNKNIEKAPAGEAIGNIITEALQKLGKKEPDAKDMKEGVSLVSITKKISSKKFGKK